MNKTQPICSIVIVNWKSFDYLKSCIKSIATNTKINYELIVIDNYSGNEEQKNLKNISDIKLILNKTNVGFAAANNQGFKIAKGEYIFMLNPDTFILNNAIDNLINFLSENNNIHAAAPKLYYSEARDYHPSVKCFPSPLTELIGMLPLARFFNVFFNKSLLFNRNKIQRVDCVWGCAIMFKRQVFEKIGFLDERFFIYSEEVDFCKRMALKNMQLYYFPKAELIHYGGKSQKKSSKTKNELIWISFTKYFEKYYSPKYILINYAFLMFILKLKIYCFKKKELIPAVKIIEGYVKCAKTL